MSGVLFDYLDRKQKTLLFTALRKSLVFTCTMQIPKQTNSPETITVSLDMLMRTHEIIIRNNPGVTSLRFGGGYDDLDFEVENSRAVIGQPPPDPIGNILIIIDYPNGLHPAIESMSSQLW